MPKEGREHQLPFRMSVAERVRAASATLPYFADEAVTVKTTGEVVQELSLGEGRTNQNFVVSTSSGKRCFVRVGGNLPHHAVVRAHERAVQRAAAAQGLAPEVLYAQDDMMAMAFVDGRALTEADVHHATGTPGAPLLRVLLDAVRKLHRTPPPPELGDTSAVGWQGPHLPQWIAYCTKGGFDRLPLLAEAKALIPVLEAAAGPLAEPALCHFDLLPDNFVVSGDISNAPQISLVDYEYTGVGQPLMDLAIFSMGCSLGEQEDAAVLAAYLEASQVSVETIYGFKALKVLAALRETFWGVVAEVSKASALSDEEAAAYADMNYAKLCELRKAFEATPAP